MSTRSFASLNDKEFEVLAVDILGVILGVRIERFKAGRDKGVDGRFFTPNADEVILQCKHWEASGYSLLRSKLQSDELPKLRALKPKRYILVTSVGLTRANKDEIKALLAPWINSSDDIFGAEDLSDFLIRHEEVEKRHPKLWLTSTAALQAILHNGVIQRSSHELEEIQQEAFRYVRTKQHVDAIEKLEIQHSIIITGEPGAGKTTLSRQLALEYAFRNYELVVVHTIKEAEDVYSPQSKQIFLYDDFLGSNYLDALDGKTESQTVQFLNRVHRDSSKRFLLTSRSTILNQGKILSEKFRIHGIDQKEYEFKVELLDEKEKGLVLYNHMWFQRLSETHVEELRKDKRYWHIIRHKNFNPRLIEFVTSSTRLTGVPSDSYWEFVQNKMDNPADIWAHVFQNQLKDPGRLITLLVGLEREPISEQALKKAFFSAAPQLHGWNDFDTERNFHESLPIITGALVNREVLSTNGKAYYSLFSPSIRDYILSNYSRRIALMATLIASLSSDGSILMLRQLHSAKIISKDQLRSIVDKIIYFYEQPKQYFPSSFSAGLINVFWELFPSEHARSWAATKLKEIEIESLSNRSIDWMRDTVHDALLLDEDAFSLNFLERLAEKICENISYENDLEAFDMLVYSTNDTAQAMLSQYLSDAIITYWEDQIQNSLEEEDDKISEIYDENSSDEVDELAKKFLEERLRIFNIQLTSQDKKRILRTVDASSIIYGNQKRMAREERDYYPDHMSEASEDSDQFVDDLFSK